MFFFPYATDAPVYHWPYATIGLIVVNTLLFFGVPLENVTPDSPWMVSYGAGMRPEQWFGGMFMHGGFFHLLSNMVFLWAFGLVVEGKLGAARFLSCYLAIGVGQAALEQLFMLGYTGDAPGSLGASSAIYGVVAMAAVWAPANSISFFYWLFLPGTFEAPVGGVAGFFVGMDLIFAVMLGGDAASSLLHVMGAALGFPLGVLLLRRGVVDCEGWDLFARLGVKRGNIKKQRGEPSNEEARQRRQQESAERDSQTLVAATKQIDTYLTNHNPAAAAKLYRKLQNVGTGLQLDRTRLHTLIQGLQSQGLWSELAPLMVDLIEQSPDRADGLRVQLAQVCVTKLGRPGRALELLSAANQEKLNEKQRGLAEQIAARSRHLQNEGTVELDDDSW